MATATATVTATATATVTTTSTTTISVTETSQHLEASKVAFANADAYDAHRPSYPPAAMRSVMTHTWLKGYSRARVLEIAAGTGKCTEMISAQDELFETVAIEPTESMRMVLAAKKLRGVTVRDGCAERMDLPSRWADGAICAQSFHWFANIDALKEIRRVLKPGAKLAMMWNIADYDQPEDWKATTKWEQILKDRILKFTGLGPPRFRHDTWPKVFENQPHFSTPVQTEVMAWKVHMKLEALWERIKTISHVATLAEKELKEFKELFDEAVKPGNGDFNEHGEVEVHYVTYMAWVTCLA